MGNGKSLDRISSPDGADVDHFSPWARYPDNGIDNLAIANRRCNGNKREFLVSRGLDTRVKEWVARFDKGGRLSSDLKAIAEQQSWEQRSERTIRAHAPHSAICGLFSAPLVDLPGRDRSVSVWSPVDT